MTLPVLFIAAYLFLAITHDARAPLLHALFQLWLVGVLAAYFTYCWRRGGQTLAMKTWHIRLRPSDGSPLSLWQALARFFLAAASLALLGAGFLWGFVDRDRQFLHDRLIGTRLYRSR